MPTSGTCASPHDGERAQPIEHYLTKCFVILRQIVDVRWRLRRRRATIVRNAVRRRWTPSLEGKGDAAELRIETVGGIRDSCPGDECQHVSGKISALFQVYGQDERVLVCSR